MTYLLLSLCPRHLYVMPSRSILTSSHNRLNMLLMQRQTLPIQDKDREGEKIVGRQEKKHKN